VGFDIVSKSMKRLSKKPLKKESLALKKASGKFLCSQKESYLLGATQRSMKVQFKSFPSNNPSLFPEDIFAKIPENHPVRLVAQVVDQLDIDPILNLYKGGGTTSFHPRMMIKVLFYSYLNNIYSCRKMEKALHENIYFMWLSGNSTPDYRTINYFRGKRLKGLIQGLFADVVMLLHQLEYVSLNVQYIDGTKIESAANRYTFVWKGSVEKNKAKLELKINNILNQIEAQIKQEQKEINKEEIVKPINSSELRQKISQLNEKNSVLAKDSQKQLKKLNEQDLPRLEKYEKQLEILGERNSFSKTDPDATFMRLKDDHMQNGQLKPAYNTQISTEGQFITHFSIHQTPADTTTLESHLDSFEQQYGLQSQVVVADAGYGSEENYDIMQQKQIDPYVKFNYFHKEQKRKYKNDPFSPQNLYYNSKDDYYICPMGQKMQLVDKSTRTTRNGYNSEISHYKASRCEGCPLRGMCHKSEGNRKIEINHNLNKHKEKVREMLHSEEGLYYRRKRPVEVEAVFGQMKSNNRFTRFTLKGFSKIEIEFGLMALGHNLRKAFVKMNKSGNNSPKTAKNTHLNTCKLYYGLGGQLSVLAA
jgi:transposase